MSKVRSTSTPNDIHFYDGCNLKLDSIEVFPRSFTYIGNAKGQIKPKAVWAHRRFSQKMIEQISFVFCEKQKKQTKQMRAQTAFGFI